MAPYVNAFILIIENTCRQAARMVEMFNLEFLACRRHSAIMKQQISINSTKIVMMRSGGSNHRIDTYNATKVCAGKTPRASQAA